MDWNRKELKKAARNTIKKNYIQIFIICLISAIIAGGYASSALSLELGEEMTRTSSLSIVDSVMKILDNAGVTDASIQPDDVIDELDTKLNLRNASEGVFATIINNTGASKSFLVGILNTINQFIFGERLLEGSIMTAATLITLAFWLFVQNILRVGECRFHLENKFYPDSNSSRLFFVYRVQKTMHVAGIMFLRYFYNALWFFTIAGGFIKIYSYRMIPYILAENPAISRKDAFGLSQAMMKGNKWAAFKLDLSFVWWHILSIFTLGALRYLYLNPFLGTTEAELYFILRQKAVETATPLSEYLNDSLLSPAHSPEITTYPRELFTLPERRHKDLFQFDYDRSYSPSSYVLIFFSVSFVGWIWEVFLYLSQHGKFVNRGTLLGPWLPIYGSGAILILLILKPLIKRPALLFPSIFLLCGVLEYFTSWLLETLFHTVWWDYRNMFLNLNGRICLEGLLFFCVGGFLIVYFIAPVIDELLNFIPPTVKRGLCSVLVLLFIADFIYSSQNPNQGEGVTVQVNSSDNFSTSDISSSSQ